jgi:hypothetical protein
MPTNDGDHVIAMYTGTAAEEMAALEQLGPLTRQAIYDSPIRYSAIPILKQIRDYEEEQRNMAPSEMRHLVNVDPKDPRLDVHVALGVRDNSIKIVGQDRSQHDAEISVIPLRPRISVKSIREQRRSARRVRW